MKLVRAGLWAAALVLICAGAWGETAPRSTISVGVWTLYHDREAELTPLAGATLRLCEGCKAEAAGEFSVHAEGDRLVWAAKDGKSQAGTVLLLAGGWRIAARGGNLTMAYPLRISARAGVLEFVATLPVERYVELVVAAESGAGDGPESRRSLAVVARSFALHPAHGHAGFDVCDSTHCQWVHWRTTAEAHAAEQATAGESLWRDGGRAEAYFHQNCGGRTAGYGEVWPGRAGGNSSATKGLVSREDPYCRRLGSSEWSDTLSRVELTKALAAAGLVRPGWKSLAVAGRGESGRATMLQVDGTKVTAEDFRLAVGRALGWNRIRSNWFEVSAQGDGFLFHGRGSGHGVGLCQTGAAEMGREGRGYREILAQYFPGAVSAEETTGAAWQSFPGDGFALETSAAADAGYLKLIAQGLGEAKSRSGFASRGEIVVRAYRSTPAFRDATLAPGWVAAFTEGDRIAVQPLRVLAARKLLEGTLRHEFVHALVEEQAGSGIPLWLREGLVEVWAGDLARGGKPGMALDLVNARLAHAGTLAEAAEAHRAAEWYAQRLIERYGRERVVEWLRAGVPESALAVLR